MPLRNIRNFRNLRTIRNFRTIRNLRTLRALRLKEIAARRVCDGRRKLKNSKKNSIKNYSPLVITARLRRGSS